MGWSGLHNALLGLHGSNALRAELILLYLQRQVSRVLPRNTTSGYKVQQALLV
jgi:hypothetical protein